MQPAISSRASELHRLVLGFARSCPVLVCLTLGSRGA